MKETLMLKNRYNKTNYDVDLNSEKYWFVWYCFLFIMLYQKKLFCKSNLIKAKNEFKFNAKKKNEIWESLLNKSWKWNLIFNLSMSQIAKL